MIRGTLGQLARATQGRVQGEDVAFQGLSTDTRSLRKGELFVALQGPNFDGRAFVAEARRAGAAAVLVQGTVSDGGPALVVADSRRALGLVARQWRRQLDLQLVAITGSNGKTTVKQMLAAIAANAGATLATQGNLNNDIGVPLTLAALAPQHRYAVIEMGANHAGEIAWLSTIAEPLVAVLNNAGPAHLEGFGSLEGVARAKGELFQLLREGGVAVINADDPFAPLWREFAEERQVMDFGTRAEARVRALGAGPDGRQAISTPKGTVHVRLPVPGSHNLMNALAATAAALALDISLEHIRAGLEGFRPAAGRLQSGHSPEGALIINDTYNANPASLAAALTVLAEQAGQAETWLVLGDMAELGAQAQALHAEAGQWAAAHGVKRLFTVGHLSAAASAAFGVGASHFQDRDALTASLRELLRPDVAVLVKGSRSMGMEAVAAALLGSGSSGSNYLRASGMPEGG